MAKLTKCKSCEKEIVYNIKECPHCGQKSPGFNGKKFFIGFFIVVAILTFIVNDNISINEKTIYKKDYGEKWAFTKDSVILKCYKDDNGISPVVKIDGANFGLTGYADMHYGQNDLNAIDIYWLKDEKLGIRKDLGIFTEQTKALCEN